MLRSRLRILPIVVMLAAVGCAGAKATPTPPPATRIPTASPAPATVAPATGQSVVLSEWKVAVAGTQKAGSVVFNITNTGAAPHELLVFKTDPAAAAFPTNSAGGIDESKNPPMSDGDNIDPAGSQTRTIVLAPGSYLFVCNLPGHYTQGMYTIVTVTS